MLTVADSAVRWGPDAALFVILSGAARKAKDLYSAYGKRIT